MKYSLIFLFTFWLTHLHSQNYFSLNKIVNIDDFSNKNFFVQKIHENKIYCLFINRRNLDTLYLRVNDLQTDSLKTYKISIPITQKEGISDIAINEKELAILTRDRVIFFNLVSGDIFSSKEKEINYFNFDRIDFDGTAIFLIKQLIHKTAIEKRYAFQKFYFENNIVKRISNVSAFIDYPNSCIDYMESSNYYSFNKNTICFVNQFHNSLTVIDKDFNKVKILELKLTGWDTTKIDSLNYLSLMYNIRSTSKALDELVSFVDNVSYISKINFLNDTLLLCEANLIDSLKSFEIKSFIVNINTNEILFINDIKNLQKLDMKANVSYNNYPLYVTGSNISCSDGLILVFRKNTKPPAMNNELLRDYFSNRNFANTSFFEILKFNGYFK
jgi:hypothetical protein